MTFTDEAPSGTGPGRNGLGDFDFLVGTWDGIQRRLVKPLADCTEWDEFETRTRCWPVLGGAGNVDELSSPDGGFIGLTVRLLNPATGQWALHWASSKDGDLAPPPVVGEFTDGVGLFYCQQDWEGQQITVRYKWFAITQESARWEQAFSVDGGQTWETNWTAVFTRTS
jgi:hypothetical protein